MSDTSTKKLTEGNAMKLIIGFALPLLGGMLFQQMYNLMDTIIVGKCLGVDALAAVGCTGSLNFLIIGFCQGVTWGFVIPVAQRFGAENYDSMRRYVTNSVILSAIMSVAMTVVVCVLCKPILLMMNTPENIMHDAWLYIFIIFLGIPATYVYNLTSGIMRSLGDSKTPVYFLVFASLLNIALDFFFILVLGTGVEGPAIATVISQLLSGLACALYLKKKFPLLKFKEGEWKPREHNIEVLLAVGVPMGLQYSITAIGTVVLQSAINSLGSDAVAAITSGIKLQMFLVIPFDALGSTMATFAGQNIGASKPERIRKGTIDALILGAIYSAIILVVIYLVSHKLLLLFLDQSETAIIANARAFLIRNGQFYFTLAIVNIVRFSIQGMGYSALAICSGIMELIARVLVAVTFVPIWGFSGAIWANPVAWLFADAFLLPTFFFLVNRKIKQLKKLTN